MGGFNEVERILRIFGATCAHAASVYWFLNESEGI